MVTDALNYGEIKSNPERVSNIKPNSNINKYKWKGINYPSKIDDWKTFEKNNTAILLIFFISKEKNVSSLYLKN